MQFQLVFKTGVFSKKMWDMFWGVVKKNQVFMANIELTNGYSVNGVALIVSSVNLAANKQVPTLPTLNVVLTLADTRTM